MTKNTHNRSQTVPILYCHTHWSLGVWESKKKYSYKNETVRYNDRATTSSNPKLDYYFRKKKKKFSEIKLTRIYDFIRPENNNQNSLKYEIPVCSKMSTNKLFLSLSLPVHEPWVDTTSVSTHTLAYTYAVSLRLSVYCRANATRQQHRSLCPSKSYLQLIWQNQYRKSPLFTFGRHCYSARYSLFAIILMKRCSSPSATWAQPTTTDVHSCRRLHCSKNKKLFSAITLDSVLSIWDYASRTKAGYVPENPNLRSK